MKHIVIIGSGFGGLSAAALLAKKRYKVTVLEKHDQPGGRAGMIEEGGFRFDMGPSWYLMPDVFERFFKHFDLTPQDVLNLKRLDPSYRLFFGNEEIVDVPKDAEGAKQLFESLETGGGEKFEEYLKISEYQYNVSMDRFMYRDYTSIKDFADKQLMKEGSKLRVFSNINKYVRSFFKDDRARKILQYNIVFLGGTPKKTPALYSIMAHIDFNMGVWYPEGGMNAVARATYELAKKQGAEFHFNQDVQSIDVDNGTAKSVTTNSQTIDADIVLSNADYHFTETKLLDPEYRSYSKRYWEKRTIAPSAFILYLGINKKLKKLEHHNLFLDNDWEKHFDTIFNAPGWPESPSYYVCCPSKTDATVAPEGKENLFVLVPVAAGLKDTDEVRQEYRDKIIKHLETLIGEPFEDDIEVEKVFAHREFSNLFNSFKGTALGLSHTLLQTAALRPQNQSKKVNNLFFTGHYIHPGIGVPMAYIAAEIVTKKIQNHDKARS